MHNDHARCASVRAALTKQADLFAARRSAGSARARAALAEDSSLHKTRIRMARHQAERDLDAARKGAVKVRILGGNTVAGRIGRRWENRSAAIIVSTPTIIVVWVLLPLAFYGLLWYSLIADTDEYWPALLALCVAFTITNLKLVFGFWMDLTLLKFCYQHIVSWLNLVNVLRWSVAFLLCRGGTATNVVFNVVTMCFVRFYGERLRCVGWHESREATGLRDFDSGVLHDTLPDVDAAHVARRRIHAGAR